MMDKFWSNRPSASVLSSASCYLSSAAPTVLVVDDEAVNRVLARALLQHLGWHVHECEDGMQALNMLCQQQYDVVLLDISLPDICGSELCSTIRATCRNQLPRLVAYTAMAMPNERPGLLAAGFDDILFKPVNLALMRAAFAWHVDP